MRYLFGKKSKIMARVLSEYIHIDGYTVDKTAFPFGITKNFFISTDDYSDYKKIKEWAIINRFSGLALPLKFKTKKQAEQYFDVFAEIIDINDIEFKNPKSDFSYAKVSYQALDILCHRKYLKLNSRN